MMVIVLKLSVLLVVVEMHITINGKKEKIDQKTLWELRDEHDFIEEDLITILDGYQTNENLPLYENASVTFIKKGELPPQELLEAMLCARHTPGVYEKVKEAKVAVAGLGGLGSLIALSLARTGVGQLHLVDFDVVEPSNLNRQQYRVTHLGKQKTEALKMEIGEINPFITVKTSNIKVTEKNAIDLFKEDEIICEAFDNPEAKAMLVNTLLTEYPDKALVAASGMAGYETSNSIRTKKAMRNFYLCGDEKTDARIGRGLMAPRVAICAGHQANMVIRLILGEEKA